MNKPQLKLSKAQKRLLETARTLPIFGFWQGLFMSHPQYFLNHFTHTKDLILNSRPQNLSTLKIPKYSIFLKEIKLLLAHNYIQQAAGGFNEHGSWAHTYFKITDRGNRVFKAQRLHYYKREVTFTQHDLLVTSVLLVLRFKRGFTLLRPCELKTRDAACCTQPDGAAISPQQEIWRIEVERRVTSEHLETHMRHCPKDAKVMLIFHRMTRPVRDFTLHLLHKYELTNWVFTSKKVFFESKGTGLFFD